MAIRYQRREEWIADRLKQSAAEARDVQRFTGTERRQTADTADAALEAADAAQETADGKNTVVRSTSPATAAGSYKAGDQWWQFSGTDIVGLWLHSGTDWVAQELTNAIIASLDAGKITTGILAADRIGANSITTAKLSATAIDGMTITGALIRTAASGSRLELNTSGLSVFDATDTETAYLTGGAGGLTIGAPASSKYANLSNEALSFNDTDPAKDASIFGGSLNIGRVNTEYQLSLGNKWGFVSRNQDVGNPTSQFDAVEYDVHTGLANMLVRHRKAGSADEAVAFMRARTRSGSIVSEVQADEATFTTAYVEDIVPTDVSGTFDGAIIAEATETTRGTVERATQAEVDTGTDTTRFVSPATVRNREYAPYSESAGTVAKRNVTAAAVVNVQILWASGRFTSAPVVTAVPWGDARDTQVLIDVSTTGGVMIRLCSNSTVTRNFGAHWHAVQMTSSSGAG